MAKTSKKQTAEQKTKSIFAGIKKRYAHVKSIAAVGDSGKPTRVNIGCVADGCKEEREIATQDAFQVSRCTACQREHAKRARRKTPAESKPKSPKARTRKPRRRTTSRKRTTATA